MTPQAPMQAPPEDLVKELARLERTTNSPMGVSCVRSILHYLERGQISEAYNVRHVEGDKTRQYPEIEAVLYQMFGCRQHAKFDCDNWLCEKLHAL